MIKLDIISARNLILSCQFPQVPSSGLPAAEALINHLGYIQIDTIHVIERAHHHVIWSRLPDYTPHWLDALQKERRIFEYWGHAMSYMAMSDFRFVLPRMKNFHNPRHPWFKKHLETHGDLLPEILNRIRHEGPLSAKDFEHKREQPGSWWDWKPAKIALELLFWQGELMVSQRHKFQKIYDLTERVLPAGLDVSMPSTDETARFIIRKALQAFGIATAKEIARFMQPDGSRDSDMLAVAPEIIFRVLNEWVEEGEVAEAEIEGLENQKYYCRPDALSHTAQGVGLKILSPFDNLVIQRNRLQRLFNFDYRLECYVPEAKRQFGYFVLPVLAGSRFIGRMDVRAERKTKTLLVIRFWPERDFQFSAEETAQLKAGLEALARFNNCSVLEYDAFPGPLLA